MADAFCERRQKSAAMVYSLRFLGLGLEREGGSDAEGA
jgi:hypothetical protein